MPAHQFLVHGNERLLKACEIYDAVGQFKKVRSEQGFGALGNAPYAILSPCSPGETPGLRSPTLSKV